ncbi:MAG: ATP-dependent Clp protease ATP-binding subunit, partial [Oscillospiraceae bacterium]|nr:ATP-dependent Clp protease ATP-binding subunit [Oscillospiraceae bacterium]
MRFEERFTAGAKEALQSAQETAAAMGHGYVGTEHILYGIAKEGSGLGARVLRGAGLDEELIMSVIEQKVGRGEPGAPVQGLTPRAKRVIELAVAEANRLGHGFVGTEHMLMGILREYDSFGARIITAAGVDLNRLYTDVMNAFRAGEATAAASAPAGKTGRAGGAREETKTLDQFSRDLTEAARKGELDPVIGRDKEVRRVIQILSRRTKNNPVLIG